MDQSDDERVLPIGPEGVNPQRPPTPLDLLDLPRILDLSSRSQVVRPDPSSLDVDHDPLLGPTSSSSSPYPTSSFTPRSQSDLSPSSRRAQVDALKSVCQMIMPILTISTSVSNHIFSRVLFGPLSNDEDIIIALRFLFVGFMHLVTRSPSNFHHQSSSLTHQMAATPLSASCVTGRWRRYCAMGNH